MSQSLKTTGQNEDWKHYFLKAIVYKLLKDKGHDVYTECDKGWGRVDVFDATTGTVYEIETHPRTETTNAKFAKYSKSVYVKEIIILDARAYVSLERAKSDLMVAVHKAEAELL